MRAELTKDCYACGHAFGICTESGCTECHCGGFMDAPEAGTTGGNTEPNPDALASLDRLFATVEANEDVDQPIASIEGGCYSGRGDYDIVLTALRAAPPSAPTDDGMPTVTEKDREWLEARLATMAYSAWQPASNAEATEARKSRILALLDWATRLQQEAK